MLMERAEWMVLNEELTFEWDQEKCDPYASQSITFINRITDTLSKKIVQKLRNRYGAEVWPWERAPIR